MSPLAAFGKSLEAMKPDESLWPGASSEGITSGTFHFRLLRPAS